jgi:hypothetical protein
MQLHGILLELDIIGDIKDRSDLACIVECSHISDDGQIRQCVVLQAFKILTVSKRHAKTRDFKAQRISKMRDFKAQRISKMRDFKAQRISKTRDFKAQRISARNPSHPLIIIKDYLQRIRDTVRNTNISMFEQHGGLL